MDHSTDLGSATIAILGLGLMGGSLAKAMQGRCRLLLGYDPNPNTLELALSEHIVNRAVSDPREILPKADLVILAAPVRAIINLIRELPGWHPGGPVVIDLGSTKRQVCEALAGLPDRFDPLGGHPMCGKSVHGLSNAEANLFQGAAFAFTPLPRTSPRALVLAAQLAEAIGARPLWLEPETHDRWVAATSHMPYLLACALALTTPLETAPLAGPGFRSATRLATSSLGMMEDILRTNRENLLQVIALFGAELRRLERLLAEEDYPALSQELQLAAENIQALVGVSGKEVAG
ncbi:MAG TPA: prephenate dehydrogenase [Anaerolineales bacterium]|nr:prephenate dehydrogenase [Anaerolineales bacterium]